MKDILIKAAKTFIQGFLGFLSIKLVSADLNNMAVIKSLLVGGAAAGFSAEMNLILSVINNNKTTKEEKGDVATNE